MEAKEGSIFLGLDDVLEILGNPTRRIILSKLAKLPLGASELASVFGKDISRQAIHSQLQKLLDVGIIENIADERNPKYRIKSNISLRIDITPDYYNIKYHTMLVEDKTSSPQLAETGCHIDYEKIKNPEKKLRFLGEKIKEIEQGIKNLEEERNALLRNKECFIIEAKDIIERQYEDKLEDELPNLEKEIFFTLFYDPLKYFKRINLDNLIDDMFFSKMGRVRRQQQELSLKHLLKDLSKFMDFLRKDKDDWIFDI